MDTLVNLTIKNIPIETNFILSEKAKKHNMSKNSYLIKLLNTHAMSEEVEGLKSDYEELVKQAFVIIQKNTEVMQHIIETIEG
ncbi:hypothetical protein C672_3560 [[Clostridium] bifermentans ATCC 638]|uniref:Uncharacterized protein n=1 Tax=Paraclostridium bifermentans ATCC 638 = DSM 14991 TaxID=1233171 RepID=T4VEK6_PARBF|nr:hypothetical protein [Paraclostridium bifermentans]EQK39953.1 hypothetical protein C672_3560 [[Clostridium] bifermentans ATCC 638] [Paraclostridium bifermentans ATCC 638 = DSM 14991]RIZ57486.1 hypothetical protein CHH45_15955 [Paraclostridium bifermentans]UAG19951.1 hypothetical protein KXZ80_17255 [Paraclostridium bifermentans]